MKIDPHRLGRRIRAARRARGLTQTQLAALLGISVTHLSHIENDRAGASLEILVRLMELLDLTPNRLFCGTEDPPDADWHEAGEDAIDGFSPERLALFHRHLQQELEFEITDRFRRRQRRLEEESGSAREAGAEHAEPASTE
ncbi:MAG: helix-turn-helix domain-containing protein [Anaerovoracaceae bacterium]|jgi:transcriptional regulator with XRE-family HTH domain